MRKTKMPEITSSSGREEAWIKTLLAECGLPEQDLTPAHMDDFLSLVAGGRLTGCIGLEIYGETALLRSLAVGPGWRGRGYGAQLLAAAEAHAAARGVRTLYLLTTTAERFFTAHG